MCVLQDVSSCAMPRRTTTSPAFNRPVCSLALHDPTGSHRAMSTFQYRYCRRITVLTTAQTQQQRSLAGPYLGEDGGQVVGPVSDGGVLPCTRQGRGWATDSTAIERCS